MGVEEGSARHPARHQFGASQVLALNLIYHTAHLPLHTSHLPTQANMLTATWLAHTLTLFTLISTALCNVEKIVFLAPDLLSLSDEGPTLADLRLDVLFPTHTRLRKSHAISFANNTHTKGLSSGIFLPSCSLDTNTSCEYAGQPR